MTDSNPTFNLLEREPISSCYDHLDAVIAETVNSRRVSEARTAAGWTLTEFGWYSACGIHESDWELEDYPFPEDPEYADWASAYYHHDALDNAPITP